MNLFVKKFLDAHGMCGFYFISICLQKRWCLKSWSCSVPLPYVIKVSGSCMFLWVLSLIYISRKSSCWFSFFDWVIPWSRITYFLFGHKYVRNYQSRMVLFKWFISFQQTRWRFIGSCIYMIPEAYASKH